MKMNLLREAASAPMHTVRSPCLPGRGERSKVPAGRHQPTAPLKFHRPGRLACMTTGRVAGFVDARALCSIPNREGLRLGRHKWGFLGCCLGSQRPERRRRWHAGTLMVARPFLMRGGPGATDRCRRGASGILVVRYRPEGTGICFFEALRGRIR